MPEKEQRVKKSSEYKNSKTDPTLVPIIEFCQCAVKRNWKYQETKTSSHKQNQYKTTAEQNEVSSYFLSCTYSTNQNLKGFGKHHKT